MAEAFPNDLHSSEASVPARVSRDKGRIRDLAFHHAYIIQHQKDAEVEILKSMEMLLDFPTSANSDPVRPSDEDGQAVKRALMPFQPSDYDTLIEERNINRTCGYVLCPRPNKLQDASAKYVIVRDRSKAAGLWKSVDKKVLERWCSDDCAKRALFIRVQLNEEPAWERAGGVGGNIMLLDETNDPLSHIDQAAQLSAHFNQLSVSDEEESMATAMRNLVLERGGGDHRKADEASTRFGNVNITENNLLRDGTQPPVRAGQDSVGAHDSIEGYIPHAIGRRTCQDSASANDEADGEDNALSNLVYGT
ncbi:MAG: hypothetical protein Q9191_006035 [Dirinaria sp. TL-2023a]